MSIVETWDIAIWCAQFYFIHNLNPIFVILKMYMSFFVPRVTEISFKIVEKHLEFAVHDYRFWFTEFISAKYIDINFKFEATRLITIT